MKTLEELIAEIAQLPHETNITFAPAGSRFAIRDEWLVSIENSSGFGSHVNITDAISIALRRIEDPNYKPEEGKE